MQKQFPFSKKQTILCPTCKLQQRTLYYENKTVFNRSEISSYVMPSLAPRNILDSFYINIVPSYKEYTYTPKLPT